MTSTRQSLYGFVQVKTEQAALDLADTRYLDLLDAQDTARAILDDLATHAYELGRQQAEPAVTR